MSTKVHRFGLFELNTASRQLLKQGRRVRLQEQPRLALEMLLEEPGRLVTRQQLRERLWPSDVHVDFELGLTGTIKRLRIALDDSADNPRFIETVPKSGYRFVAPVQTTTVVAPVEAADAPPAAAIDPVAAAGVAAGPAGPLAPAAPDTPPARARARTPARPLTLRIAACVAAIPILAVFLRPTNPPPRVTRVVKLSGSGHAWPQENLLTDGARLYYTELGLGTGYRLRQILLNGNEDTVTAGLPPNSLVRALSPDHTTFLTISREAATAGEASPLWQVPVVGGPPRRLGSLRSNDFGWSPDGQALAFGSDTRLLVCREDGSDPHELAAVPGHVVSPRWSPDGRRLRFTVLGSTGELALWEVGADGSHLHPLRFGWPDPPMEGFGDWTADGRYYVFVSRREGISNIWAVEDGGDWLHRRRAEPIQLTAGPVSYNRPLPSRDGSRVFALGTEPGGELVRYDRVRKEYLPFLGGRSAEHLDWSRDGRWVAYVAYPEGTLWKARADGSEEVRLTSPLLRVSLPRWSPDGRRIVFAGTQAGAPPRVLAISAEGGNPETLLAEAEGQVDPTWSASGDSLVYGRDREAGSGDLALFRLDLGRGRSERIRGTDGLHAPLWSPDGRRLAARQVESGRLCLVDLAAGRAVPLSKRRADYAAWSADSQYLYFNSAVGEHTALFRVHVPDGAEEKVADLTFKPAGSYGSWSGLAPDGSPLVLRDAGRTDVYALSVSFGGAP